MSTVVRCGAAARLVLPTLASVEGQAGRPEIVLATDASTPAGAQEWIASLARARGFKSIHCAAGTPGAIRNAGLRVCTRPYVHCLDAGERLGSGFHLAAARWLDANPRAVLATSRLLVLGPGAARSVIAPAEVSLLALVADPDAIHSASVFRRAAWLDVGGFDDALPALDDYDFWLKLLAPGGACGVIDAHMIRPVRRDGLYRGAWDPDARRAAVQAITERHHPVMGLDPAAVLCAREEQLDRLGRACQERLKRRQQTLGAIDALERRHAAQTALGALRTAIDAGDLRRRTPLSRDWGYERGTPVDRYYIERFLSEHAADVAGVVLEVQEPDYTRRFGGDRVTESHVVDLDPANPRATVVSDLRAAANLRSGTYDCIILTQTLHVIDDMEAVVSECARLLKAGGVLLATLPCASRVSLEYGADGDFWRVTEAAARRLFEKVLPAEAITVAPHGNVFATTAFLYGFGRDELTASELETTDPYFPLLISVRAEKPPSAAESAWHPEVHVRRSRPDADHAGSGVLLYHRVATPPADPHRLAVAPDAFRAEMRHLRDEYDLVPLAELVADTGRSRPSGLVAVTFDDGYVDNATVASPILSELGIPATFLVTTERLDEPYAFWWDTLARLVLTSWGPNRPPTFTVMLPDGPRTLHGDTAGDRRAAHDAIYHAIAGSPGELRERTMDDLRRLFGEAGPDPEARRMTGAEVAEVARRPGHSVGAHTVRHLMLPQQPPEIRRLEIEESRRCLEALIGSAVTSLSYPFGAIDADTREAARAAGIELALTCGDAPLPRHPDRLALPRLDPASRGDEAFDEWLWRQLGPPRSATARTARTTTRTAPVVVPARRRALVAGWFSYPDSDSTAGDFLACDLVCEWLGEAGVSCDVALAPPFAGGVDLELVDPAAYSHAVFVCGPFLPNQRELAFAARFSPCRLVGVNLSLPVALHEWNPFDVLLERDSSEGSRPDITFASEEPGVPILGVCLVERYDAADTASANAAVQRLLAGTPAAVVPIDTRLDRNTTGLRTSAEVASLLARMDAVVTTRLHGMVLSLRHGVPVVAIDPEPGGFRVRRQAEAVGWPAVFTVDAIDDRRLRDALRYCLSVEARDKAAECRDRARTEVGEVRRRLLEAFARD
jgi:peptidoglycan/xylan/chitin deacetylase (PgdA/CDA1 family)